MQPILIGSSRHASGVARSLARALSGAGIPCTLSRAQETVARMFGHRDWHAMAEASKGRAPTAADDEVPSAEASARRERFQAVLVSEFSLPRESARRIVGDVNPTGRRQPRAQAVERGYPALDAAIAAGATVRAFRSGGGLRVIRVERGAQGTKLVGYGEAPHLKDALRHADEDTSVGGRPYGEVYGKAVPHYLTGAWPEGDPLDEWVFQGHGLRAVRNRGMVLATLSGTMDTEFPQDVIDRVIASGRPEEFEARGMLYRMRPGSILPGSVSLDCVRPSEDGRDPYTAYVLREGRAATLREALDLALAAEGREVARDAFRA